MEQVYFNIILAVVILGFGLEQLLEYLNNSNRPQKRPKELEEFYSEEKYREALAYRKVNNRLGNTSAWLNFVIMVALLNFGGFAWLNDILLHFFKPGIWLSIGYFGLLFFLSDLLSTPFSVYKTFVIEEQFGFNRTSFKTWFVDKFKGYFLAILLGGSLLYALLSIINYLGQDFWIYAWVLLTFISIFMSFFYTTLFLPLFNKLSPLENEELKEKIVLLSKDADFPLQKIKVMDASKRSNKANAFFSGFGKLKTIVLFDTLIEQHTHEELLSILAHEIGHYKKRHVVSNMSFGILLNGLMLWLLAQFMFDDALSKALGADNYFIHLNIVAFTILYTPISLITGLIGNIISRKHEFEADAFAVKYASGRALIDGLKKLSTQQLSDLKPHPVYSFFYYSHPPLLQRIKAIREKT